MADKLAQKVRNIFIPCKANHYRPKFLSSHFLTYYLIVLIVLKFVTLPILLYLPKTSLFASLTRESIINLTNEKRSSLGLAILGEDPLLDEAAYRKAQDMFLLDYFDHNSPEGRSAWYWLEEVGYKYKRAGENLAIGFLEAEEVFRAWEESASHQENIISPRYNDTGVAVLSGNFQGQEVTVIVQLFGSRIKTSILSPEAQAQEIFEHPDEEASQEEETFSQWPSEIIEEGTTSIFWDVATSAEGQIIIISTADDSVRPVTIKFFQFLTDSYFDWVNKLVLCSLMVMVIISLATIFINIHYQPIDLILKGFFFILVFIFFILINKEVLVRIFSHGMSIG